jgi:ABC-type branched-subunit amino acid transport system ATPase component
MRIFHYLTIENFKGFGEAQRIELDHPAVLIGPNNSGKTTAMQALALWSHAVKIWHQERSDSEATKRKGVALNRLAIVAVPVERTRLFWHDTRQGPTNNPTYFFLEVGLAWKGGVAPLRLQFRHGGDELIYVQPDSSAESLDPALLEHAAALKVHLLYSMSGLQVSEPVLVPAYIDSLLGQGRTAEVLRNLCLMVYSANVADWGRIVSLMKRLFGVTLGIPTQNAIGTIELSYEQERARDPLSLGMAGRGFLQVLLILSYLYSHRNGVLLIDEPDAHLEILRQRQVYQLLRDIADETGAQVVLVTHSEAVLEAALDRNLTLLVDGRAEPLASHNDIKNALKHYGTGHYVRAREAGHVLYVEGGTDVDMLRALASRLGHALAGAWNERGNIYFVQDNFPGSSAEAELERVEGGFGFTPEKHFFAIRSLVEGLRGLAILDNDGKDRKDSHEAGLRRVYWRRYEIENYFITPELLLAYVEAGEAEEQPDLFAPRTSQAIVVMDELVLERIFAGRQRDFDTYRRSDDDTRQLLWESRTERLKLSDFAEEFFRRLSTQTSTSMLLRKGDLHRLVAWVEPTTIDAEVIEKLDLLYDLWSKQTATGDA